MNTLANYTHNGAHNYARNFIVFSVTPKVRVRPIFMRILRDPWPVEPPWTRLAQLTTHYISA